MRIHRHADEGEMNEVRCGGEDVKWGEGGGGEGRGGYNRRDKEMRKERGTRSDHAVQVTTSSEAGKQRDSAA